MRHDYGNAAVVLRHRHDAFSKRNLAAWQCEGVDVLALEDVEFSCVLRPVGYRCDTLPNPTQLCLPVTDQ